MRVTDQAVRALVLGAEAAHTLGDTPVSGRHLLAGLAEAEGGARHVLGSSAELLHGVAQPGAEAAATAKDAALLHGVAQPGAEAAATAKDIVEGAIRHAYAAGRDRATTADILFVALESLDGTVTSALRAAGADPVAVRAELAGSDHGECCRETGVSAIRPILAEMGAHADRLPGFGRALAGMVGGLIPYALLLVAVLGVAWDTSGPEIILGSAAGTFLLSLLIGPLVLRRRVRRLVARAPVVLPLPESARPLVERLGLRQFEVRVQAELAPDRCCRLGRRAWILLGPGTERVPEPARFVLWHEVAHLARRDTMARRLYARAGVGLVVGAVNSFDVRAMAVAVAGAGFLTVAGFWWSEAACDRFAVRRVGPAALHAWAEVIRNSRAALRRQRRRPVRGLLTHPPLALRTALHPQSTAPYPKTA